MSAASDPRVAAYEAIVTSFLPGCAGRELDLRCRLLLARDTSTLALRNCTDEAAGIYGQIERLGTLHAYAPLDEAGLEQLLQCQRRLIAAATIAEDLFAEPQS